MTYLTCATDPLTLAGDPLTIGGDMIATYLPRVKVHDDRYGSVKTTANILIVIHTSEGTEGGTSAQNLAAAMTLPGDRQNPDGTFYGSSYHYVTELNRRGIPCVPDHTVAYAAAGANHNGVHICIPGRAGQTRAQWLDSVSRQYIEAAAAITVDVARREHIPLVKLSTFQVAAGRSGYCGHVEVSQAFKRSDHTDPGVSFPWDVFAADIARFTEEPDDMTPEIPPRRLMDTRNMGAPVAVGQVVELGTAAAGKAVAVNLTVTQPEGPGYLVAWGSGPEPGVSNVNYIDRTVANHSVVPLDNGLIRFTVRGAPAHVVVDLQGVYA